MKAKFEVFKTEALLLYKDVGKLENPHNVRQKFPISAFCKCMCGEGIIRYKFLYIQTTAQNFLVLLLDIENINSHKNVK